MSKSVFVVQNCWCGGREYNVNGIFSSEALAQDWINNQPHDGNDDYRILTETFNPEPVGTAPKMPPVKTPLTEGNVHHATKPGLSDSPRPTHPPPAPNYRRRDSRPSRAIDDEALAIVRGLR